MTADSTKTSNSRTQAGMLLGRHSIRLKLILIMMAVSSAALLLVGAAFVAGQVVFFREQMKSDLATQAELLAEENLALLDKLQQAYIDDVLTSQELQTKLFHLLEAKHSEGGSD